MVTVIGSIPVSSGITISRITRVGDIGEPGYSVYGEDLPACKKRNAHDSWHGATQGNNVAYAMPSRCYITENVYDFLTPGERENIRSYVRGIVANSYWKNGTCPYYPHSSSPVYSVSTARPMPLPDTCAGVVCKPVCVGVDRYATVCKDGKCVRGGLMEANSTTCGYVAPVCAEGAKRGKMTCWDGAVIYGEVCRGNRWVTSGKFCPPKPECAEGDKKPGYICSGGKWVPYTPAGPVPGEGRLYVKFDIPWLDMLPGIPYEPWMIIPPGFKIVEEKQ